MLIYNDEGTFFLLAVEELNPGDRIGPDGEIGRRKRLKISRFYNRAGSTPARGTI